MKTEIQGMTEGNLLETERKIRIVLDNQIYGLQDYPDIKKRIKDVGESITAVADSNSSLANILAGLQTNKSILEIAIEKLRVEYRAEGERLKKLYDK